MGSGENRLAVVRERALAASVLMQIVLQRGHVLQICYRIVAPIQIIVIDLGVLWSWWRSKKSVRHQPMNAFPVRLAQDRHTCLTIPVFPTRAQGYDTCFGLDSSKWTHHSAWHSGASSGTDHGFPLFSWEITTRVQQTCIHNHQHLHFSGTSCWLFGRKALDLWLFLWLMETMSHSLPLALTSEWTCVLGGNHTSAECFETGWPRPSSQPGCCSGFHPSGSLAMLRRSEGVPKMPRQSSDELWNVDWNVDHQFWPHDSHSNAKFPT